MGEGALTVQEKRSIRMVWKTLRLRHIGLGFFWACSMLTFRSSLLLIGEAGSPTLETLVVIASFVANATALFAIASFIEKSPTAYDRLPGWLFAALIVVGIALLAGAGLMPHDALMPLLIGGAVLTGVGYGYFWGSWAEVYGRMHPARTSFYIPVAYLLTVVLFLAISMAVELFGIPAFALMVPLPLISLLCLMRCRAEVPQGHYAHAGGLVGTKRYLSALGSLGSLILASLVLSCLFGFAWELTVFSVGSVNEAHRLPLVANLVVALALIGLVVFARKRIDLTVAYRIIVPVVVVLFAVLPFFWESNPILFNAVMSACYGAFDVIIWYLAVSTAFDFSVSGFVVGGIVRALSILLRLLGIGIGYLVMIIPGQSSGIILGVSLGALYFLAMIALFYRSRHRVGAGDQAADEGEADTDALSNEADGAVEADRTRTRTDAVSTTESVRVETGLRGVTRATAEIGAARGVRNISERATAEKGTEDGAGESVYDLIADDYGLTRREAEVLPYLARGRSAKIIADALFVSESTIRTHTRRILEKTDLHSKQQLIDLIETYR